MHSKQSHVVDTIIYLWYNVALPEPEQTKFIENYAELGERNSLLSLNTGCLDGQLKSVKSLKITGQLQ